MKKPNEGPLYYLHSVEYLERSYQVEFTANHSETLNDESFLDEEGGQIRHQMDIRAFWDIHRQACIELCKVALDYNEDYVFIPSKYGLFLFGHNMASGEILSAVTPNENFILTHDQAVRYIQEKVICTGFTSYLRSAFRNMDPPAPDNVDLITIVPHPPTKILQQMGRGLRDSEDYPAPEDLPAQCNLGCENITVADKHFCSCSAKDQQPGEAPVVRKHEINSLVMLGWNVERQELGINEIEHFAFHNGEVFGFTGGREEFHITSAEMEWFKENYHWQYHKQEGKGEFIRHHYYSIKPNEPAPIVEVLGKKCTLVSDCILGIFLKTRGIDTVSDGTVVNASVFYKLYTVAEDLEFGKYVVLPNTEVQ